MTAADISEIITEFLQAKCRREKVMILADQYLCDAADIIDLLELRGVAVTLQRETRGRPRGCRPIKPPVDWEKAIALYKNGAIDVEIARALGCSPVAIHDWRVRCGLPRNKRTKQSKEGS